MLRIRQFIPSRICLRCDICCRFSERDTVWSPRLLKEEEEKSFYKSKKFLPIFNQREGNFICPFFVARANKCRAYGLRPFECRLYPFLINRARNGVFLAVDPICPYVKDRIKSARFNKYSEYLAKILNRRASLGMLKENPQIMQSYEGVLNLAELKL